MLLKRPAVLFFIFLAGIATLASLPDTDPAPLPVHEEILDNGMKVLIVERHDLPRVFCVIFFKVGSVNEHQGMTGVSHMLEHMMFKGTHTLGTSDLGRDAYFNNEIDQKMLQVRAIDLRIEELQFRGGDGVEPLKQQRQALVKEADDLAREQKTITLKEELWTRYLSNGGTSLNASTGPDSTQYFVELPSNKMELFFWLETDRLRDPVFREFYSEREVVKEERRMRTENSPTGLINESFHTMFWGGHPYHWPVVGWMNDLNVMKQEDAEQYFRTYYSPRNAVAVIVGDVQTDAIVALSKKYFGSLRNAPTLPEPVILPSRPQAAERRMEAEVSAPDSLDVQFYTVPTGHPDGDVLDMMAEMLNGRSGRLHRRLVEEKKLALSASADAATSKYGGAFSLTAQPREGVALNDLEAAVMAELDILRKEPVTAQELEKARNKMLAGHINRFRENRDIAFLLGWSEAGGSSWKRALEFPKRIQGITAERIQGAAQKYCAPEQAYFLHIKRKGEKKTQ